MPLFLKGSVDQRILRGPTRAMKCSHFYPPWLRSCSSSLPLQNCHESITKKCEFSLSFKFVGTKKSSIGCWCHLALVWWHKEVKESQAWVWRMDPSVSSSIIVDSFSDPQFLHLVNGNNNSTCLGWMAWRLKMFPVNCLAKNLVS